jgi:hypothetical protein
VTGGRGGAGEVWCSLTPHILPTMVGPGTSLRETLIVLRYLGWTIWAGCLGLMFLAAFAFTFTMPYGVAPRVSNVPAPIGYVADAEYFCPGTQDGCVSTIAWFDPIGSTAPSLSSEEVADHLVSRGLTFESDGRWHKKSDWLGAVLIRLDATSPYKGNGYDPIPVDRVLMEITYADNGRTRIRLPPAFAWLVALLLTTITILAARARGRRTKSHPSG